MRNNRFYLATLAYIVVTFIIAASWHLATFKEVYEQLAIFTRKEPLIPLGLISMVLQGLVVAYCYPRMRIEGTPVTKGLKFGLLMGVFLGSGAVFGEAGKQEVTSLSTWLVLESVYYLLQFAIVGMVIGVMYGRLSADAG